MTRRCVALNPDGTLAMSFRRFKDVRAYTGAGQARMTRILENKEILIGYRWMYEKEYINAVAKGKTQKYAFGTGIPKKKRKPKELSDSEKVELAAISQYKAGFLKRRIESNMKNVRYEHKNWVRELIDTWLAVGDNAIRPWMLAEYYSDKNDIEVALISCLSFNWSGKVYSEVNKLRKSFGNSPWEYFKNRMFADKSDSLLAQILNEFWKECFSYGNYKSIGEMVLAVAERDNMTMEDVILRLLRGTDFKKTDYVSVILLTMSDIRGIGFGVWNIPRKNIVIRCGKKLKKFLQIWVPDCDRYGSDEESIKLTGLDHADFYLFYLAYTVLKKKNPSGCKEYELLYNRLYNGTNSRIKHKKIIEKMPEILL